MSEPKDERITDIQVSHYNGKVLLGNWVEDRCKYVKHITPLRSIYMEDFAVPKNTLDKDAYWKIRYHGNGLPLSHLFGYGKQEEYMKNQATIYDLSFHHRLNKHTDRTFGIVTSTGLRECKEMKWKEDKESNTYRTVHKDTFIEYPIECLQVHHSKGNQFVNDKHGTGNIEKLAELKHKPTKIVPAL